MKIIETRTEDLIPYENNPRINDGAVDAVAASIQRYGWEQPLVIDKDGVIVVGHTRYKAAQKLGIEKVPCVVADDLTDEQVREYRLVDNKTNELADWDLSKLDAELEKLDFGGFDFGFTVSEFDWKSIDEITTSSYEEPDIEKLRCPVCGAEDSKSRFLKVMS